MSHLALMNMSDLAERDRTWWQHKLEVARRDSAGEAFHELATDHRRPPSPSGRAVEPIVEQLDACAAARLTALASTLDVQLHAVLLTVMASEVKRREGRRSLIAGSRTTGSVPVPVILTSSHLQPAAAQILATQAELNQAAEHLKCPAGLLCGEFRQARASLFDVALTGLPLDASSDAVPADPAAAVDLEFSYEPAEDGGLKLSLRWNPDVYTPSTAHSWLSSFAAWARWLAEDIGRADRSLPALLPEEARRLAQWEWGPVRTRPAKRFHELFENLADCHPHRPAVITASGVESYAELDGRANRIARTLLDRGVTREERVIVLTECSADLPATVLGIWKAGAAYVPLAVDQPPARLVHMAADSGARTLMVLDGHQVPPPLAEAVDTIVRPEELDSIAGAERLEIAGTPRDLAYIIYTSGTTGKPKGVLIQHDSLVNAAYISGETFGLTQEDRFSLAATPGFDASLWELGVSLLHGMALVPVSRALRDDPWALRQWYKQCGVTVAFHAPSYLRIGKRTPFEGLRVLITGGEAPSHDDARCYADGVAFWNAYGPTEACIFVCAEHIQPDFDAARPLPVGRPLANTRISIRRESGDAAPPGSMGEVWLGGAGLARGYLNNPELTAQRFVETPDGRFYRTGDLGRWTEGGGLELAGRIDHQVKLHGQRLEPGEIEQVLKAHAAVEEATVLVDSSANYTKALRAFVRLRAGGEMPAEDEWRAYLGERLPSYMVPASVTCVAAMPLTSSGKIDRDALLLAANQRSADARKNPPSGEWETRIAAIWSELLKCTVSRDDNFFALGGNSLLAVTLAHRLSRELRRPVPARELFAAPTLTDFAQRLAARHGISEAPVRARSDVATEGQREFRTAEAAGLDTRTFTIPVMRIVEGEMPGHDRWSAAWAALVARHEALRTSFCEDADGRLRSVVIPKLASAIETASHRDRSAARAYVRRRQTEPFVMRVPPLWRVGLVEVAESGEHLFWMALHHAVGDGRSVGIMVEELCALLRGEALPPMACAFAESAASEVAYLSGRACTEDATYWSDLLARQPDECFEEIPLDFARSSPATAGNHRFETRLDRRTARELRALAREHEASLHAVMLTLLALEARRRTGRERMIVGTAASTRETAAEGPVVGCYVNMLPVPCRVPRQIPFGTVLRETQQMLAAGLQHARYPFARMYRDFWNRRPRQRHPARYPLFDLAVTENPGVQPGPAGLRLERVASPGGYERTGASPGQDMVLSHEDQADGGLVLEWHVNAALYTRETAENWFEALRGWAEWLAEERLRRREVLPALLPREERLLETWERGVKADRPPLRFHDLFERVLDTGGGQCDRPAVVTRSGITTYAALEREANAIAHALLERNAASGTVVAVLTGRSANLPAAVLGIWKAGATYLPLAADLPPERLLFMARDAGATHLISLDGLAAPPALGGELPPALRPEELPAEFRRAHCHRPAASGGPGDAAYIIYTSGSTGRPKGALISHSAYVNTVLGTGEALRLACHDRTLMFSSPSFDVSLSDIGLPLAFGAALCPVPHEVLNSPTRFREFLLEFGVTVADITPTYLRLFDGAALPSLRILITGGEAPFRGDVAVYAGRHQYWNAYGPTENTITSTMKRLCPEDQGALSSGRPLPNTSVHVCDADGNPVPPGAVGELWLGGAGLALGYVGRPDLTAAAFAETPPGRRYRSGDLGRWRADGEIEILGRADDQVKLNGIRVELGEIEHALCSHPDTSQAVALLDTNEDRIHSLWAFVRLTPGRSAPDEESWRTFLAGRLPAYMIPSAVISVPEIPLSNSGKVDKTALKKLLAGRSPRGDETPPEGSLEAEIAQVWRELLGIGAIYRDDNFFALGGHSLLAIAGAHRLEKKLGHPVPARELFAEPTLRGFARRVSQLRAAEPIPVFSNRATEGQREFWISERAGLDTRGFNIALTLVWRGQALPAARWRDAWAILVARHDSLRTAFGEGSDGVLRRSVFERVNADLEISDQVNVSTARAHIREHQTERFAMDRAPLWRAGLAHVGDMDQPVFWLALHHSVGDGVSLGVLSEELSALLQGETLPAITDHFDRRAGQEEAYLASPIAREDASYWQNLLRGLGKGSADGQKPFDEWPIDIPRPLGRTVRNAKGAHCFRIRLDAADAAGLRGLAQKHGASLHALMLTIMAHEVRRRTGRTEFLLGTAASARDSVVEARVVGYYVNMLPLPCRVEGGESVEQLLCATQQTLADGLRHSRYPFFRIFQDSRRDQNLAPHPARHPLFDIAVTENPVPRNTLSDFTPLTNDGARYELRVNVPSGDMLLVHEGQADGSLDLHWIVNAAIYRKETAEAWFDGLSGWAHFLARPERLPGSALPTLLPEEETLLAGWEHGPVLLHAAPTLPAQFEHWACHQPDRPALITEQGAQSYAVLNARANALAHALLAIGLARQERVGVLTDRSAALPETALAIWKAGGCYLPLVKDLPIDRMDFIARDAGIRIVVALDGNEPPSSWVETGCQVFRPETLSQEFVSSHGHPPEIGEGGARASDLAYIIYTSGSTGVPKGVMLRHQGLNNLGVGMAAVLNIRSDDKTLLMASPAFDAWIADLAMAWSAGAAVVPILRNQMNDIAGMRDRMGRLGVTVATMTPAYLRLFEQADFPGLRVLTTVGEPPHPADAAHYAARLRYFNGYGPTENTAAAGFGEVTADSPYFTAGRPLANTSIHVLGPNGERVPPGVAGEIWLGGMGVAVGYLNRPDLTAASFVETSAGRLYRTGDVGRWTHNGELQFLGRSDGQVKVRGHRIELGEIQHWLEAYPGVRQGVALVETESGGAQNLRAFVCLHSGAAEPSQEAWREHLSRTLPSYMVPSAVIPVPAIPMNIAGKVDRAALLREASDWKFRHAQQDGDGLPAAAPADGVERHIAEVWAAHLECPLIAREDNFFDLGGNSLRAIAVVNQLRRSLDCSVNDLYEHPRLADFAAACRQQPDYLRTLIQSVARHWRAYRDGLADYERERDAALTVALREYETRNQSYQRILSGERRNYRQVFLTGVTGYLGSYLLRELMADPDREISVLIRAADSVSARARLAEVLCHYFGPEKGTALLENPRVTVLAGDLRRDDLGLSAKTYDLLSNNTQAIFHCAANVKHFGHYREFHADNVAATGRLLKLAAHRAANPSDFHFVSTLSVCGKGPEAGFRLFTEYDSVPEVLDGNYYVRSKQEAERLVVAARENLANACIHRVGNVVYAAEGGPLQLNVGGNAFFRQIAALLHLGVAPDDSHLWLCHVDVVARGLVRLAGAGGLSNETHHLENARRDTLAAFVTPAGGIRTSSFGGFLERLEAAVDEPEMGAALTETLENFSLYRGVSPQERARRLEIVSGRTQTLLARLGLTWPPAPLEAQKAMLREAARHYSGPPAPNLARGASY